MARSKRKPAHIIQWLWAVTEQCGSAEPDRPEEPAILAVSTVRALHADPDGGHCYPAQSTVAGLAHVSRRTVGAVDQWLVDHELMQLTRRRARGLREYRLTLPDVVTQTHLATESDAPTQAHLNDVRCAPDVLQMSQVDTQPPTSDRREEEEERPSGADAPLVAPGKEARRIAQRIADQAGVAIDLDAVAAGVDRLRAARADWAPVTIVTLVAKAAGKATSNPTAYTLGAIDRLIAAEPALPVRLRVHNLIDLTDAQLLDVENLFGSDAADHLDNERGRAALERRFLPHDVSDDLGTYLPHLSDQDVAEIEAELSRLASQIRERLERAA